MTRPKFTRTTNGLIEGLEYIRKENGSIDWRAMINPKYIVFNPRFDTELLEKFGAKADKLVYADVIKEKAVEDKYILILLHGFFEVADLRGYRDTRLDIPYASAGQNVTAICHITWIPNENEDWEKTSFGSADATMENTGGFGYLAAIAGNRAFVRAVKNGLGIFVLGADEIMKKDTPLQESAGGSSPSINPLGPQGTLQSTAERLKISFDQVKKGAIKYKDKMSSTAEEIEAWNGFGDVAAKDCMSLIGLLSSKK